MFLFHWDVFFGLNQGLSFVQISQGFKKVIRNETPQKKRWRISMPTPTPDPLSDLRLDAIDVLLLVSLLAICLVVNNIIQKQSWPIPEAISTILVGSAVGGIYVAFPEVDRQLGSNCVSKRYEFKKSKFLMNL